MQTLLDQTNTEIWKIEDQVRYLASIAYAASTLGNDNLREKLQGILLAIDEAKENIGIAVNEYMGRELRASREDLLSTGPRVLGDMI